METIKRQLELDLFCTGPLARDSTATIVVSHAAEFNIKARGMVTRKELCGDNSTIRGGEL